MSAANNAIPTISRTCADGTLIELVYDPSTRVTALAVARPGAQPQLEQSVELTTGEHLVPYSAQNTLIAHECVVLPADIGDVQDKRDLLRDVQAFLHRYVDLSPAFEAIAAHYVLLTWVYDAFPDLGYLRFRGEPGSGKTRALLVVGSLCHKAFFGSGASTVSPIFHIQDAFQGTLVLDEADFRFSDATAELAKVLNNGTTRGLPVLRTMANKNRELNPTAFRVFGPKLIAMREEFEDVALESRFLTENTGGRPLRPDIPIHLPASFAGEARDLRNRLLAWRFAERRTVAGDPSRLPPTLSARSQQGLLGLLSLVDDPELRIEIARFAGKDEEARLSERRETHEGTMLAAVLAAYGEEGARNAPIGEITRRFNDACAEDLGGAMSNKWVGMFVRRRLRLATEKTGGVYVIPATERPRVSALAERFGVQASD